MSYKLEGEQTYSCMKCGSLVDNTSQHDAWHRDFTSLVELVTGIKPSQEKQND